MEEKKILNVQKEVRKNKKRNKEQVGQVENKNIEDFNLTI